MTMNESNTMSRSIRPLDVLGLSFSALRQQKTRTALTLAGVMIGTFALAMSLSIGRGVDHAIISLFHADDRLRRIAVSPKWGPAIEMMTDADRLPKGEMSDARRERLEKSLIRAWGRTRGYSPKTKLTYEATDAFAKLPHVLEVSPQFYFNAEASMDGQSLPVNVASQGPMDADLQPWLVAGRLLNDTDQNAVLIHEFLLYRWGITTDEAIQSALGKTVHINRVATNGIINHLSFIGRRDLGLKGSDEQTFTRAVRRLAFLVRFLPIPQDERTLLIRFLNPEPATTGPPKPTGPLFTTDCTIVGVLGEHSREITPFNFFTNRMLDEADLVLRAPFALKVARNDVELRAFGHETVVILADDETNVKDLVKTISDQGFTTYSLVEYLDTVRLNVLMITFATSFVAIVALAVAAIGITNTMIMSVLERTHEIGILKALGVRTVHLRLLFLVEGAVLGLAGSLLGLGLAYLASIPGNSIAKSIMEPQTNMPVKESLFIFPVWLTLGVPALTTLITTLAAVYPAHRAASVDPITSLRHE